MKTISMLIRNIHNPYISCYGFLKVKLTEKTKEVN